MFLGAEDEKLFYAGFCKQILWPLFHSSPPTTEDMIMAHAFEESGSSSDFFEGSGSGDLSGGGGGGGDGGGVAAGRPGVVGPFGRVGRRCAAHPMKRTPRCSRRLSLDAGLPSSEKTKPAGFRRGGCGLGQRRWRGRQQQ